MPDMFEAALDCWGRLRISLDLFLLGMDRVDWILAGGALLALAGMLWIMWELATWNTGTSSM